MTTRNPNSGTERPEPFGAISSRISDAHVSPVSVVIPTYNRIGALLTCLAHLERQSWTDFNVIIVDDGSTDATPQLLERYVSHSPLHTQYARQPNSGPARARNLAISLVRSPLCLIIGDDIFAAPDFVATHLHFHERNPATRQAALGLTRWSDSGQVVTPFMQWLDDSGTQFSYGDLLRGVPPNWKHFYTSNLSVKTELLRQNPFNESFTGAAMEDIELGYRLERQHALEIAFLPQALAQHLHPTDFRKSSKRAFNVGLASQRFHQLWPALCSPPRSRIRRAFTAFLCWNRWLLAPLTLVTDLLTRFWCPNPFIAPVLRLHAAIGYCSAHPPSLGSGRKICAKSSESRKRT